MILPQYDSFKQLLGTLQEKKQQAKKSSHLISNLVYKKYKQKVIWDHKRLNETHMYFILIIYIFLIISSNSIQQSYEYTQTIKQSISIRKDTHKKSVFLVVGPLRGGGGLNPHPPPASMQKIPFFL